MLIKCSEEEQLKFIRYYRSNIKFVNNINKSGQLIAIKNNKLRITFIKNPTEKIKLICL